MIKADKECIKVNGKPVDITAEFVYVVKAVREVLSDAFGNNMANATLDTFYEMSKLTDEEVGEMPREKLYEIVESICRRSSNE